jgi:hypothetical protein
LEWIPRKTTSSAFAVELAVRSLTSQVRSSTWGCSSSSVDPSARRKKYIH